MTLTNFIVCPHCASVYRFQQVVREEMVLLMSSSAVSAVIDYLVVGYQNTARTKARGVSMQCVKL